MTRKAELFTARSGDFAKSVLAEMQEKDFDMAPVYGRSGRVTGYVLKKDLERAKSETNSRVGDYDRPLTLDRILSASTPVLSHLKLWEEHSYYLVNAGNRLTGVVTYADLNRAPVRLVFYTILSEVETKLRRMVRKKMPHDSWLKHLTAGVQGRINSYYESDKRRNLEVNRAIYLMFSELLSLVDRGKLYGKLGFRSREDFVDTAKEVNELRNRIMHTKPLVDRSQKQNIPLKSSLDFLLGFASRLPD